LEDFETTLTGKIAECNEASINYITESDERERELAILAKLLDHIKERTSAVADYVSSRTGPDFFWVDF